MTGFDVVGLMNWALLLIAMIGAYRHVQNLTVLHRECADCETAADTLLCVHYKRHERARVAVKVALMLIAGYFIWRPLAVVDPVLGLAGPIFVRALLLAIAVVLDCESVASTNDRTMLSRIVGRPPTHRTPHA
jgi:hypothetical protein